MSKKSNASDTQQKTLLECWNSKKSNKKIPQALKMNINNNKNEIILIDDNLNDNDDEDFNENDLEMIKQSEAALSDKSRYSMDAAVSVACTSRCSDSSNILNRTETPKLLTVEEKLLTNIILGPLASSTNTDTTGFDFDAGSGFQFNILIILFF
jgi:hypothetical protein